MKTYGILNDRKMKAETKLRNSHKDRIPQVWHCSSEGTKMFQGVIDWLNASK